MTSGSVASLTMHPVLGNGVHQRDRISFEQPRQLFLQRPKSESASRTHPAVVRTALDIEFGAPVHPAAWSRARRRLYDTGVFRSVVSARADRDQQALRAAERTVRLPGSSIP